jgi:hypothetical protein
MPVDVTTTPEVAETAFYFGKSVHVAAYAVFTILSGWLRLPFRYRWFLLLFLSLHAFATEYIQNFVHGDFDWQARHPSFRDVGLDHLGIAIGVLCTWPWWRRDKAACEGVGVNDERDRVGARR